MNIDKNMLDSIDKYKEAKVFWEKKLSTSQGKLILPYDIEAREELSKKEYDFCLDSELSAAIAKVSNNQEFLAFIILLSAFIVQLYKYGNKENITIATPIFEKLSSEAEIVNKKVFMINTVAGEMSFKELLMSIKNEAMNCYKNQYYPLEGYVKKYKINNSENDISYVNFMMRGLHNVDLNKQEVSTDEDDLTIIMEMTNNEVFGKIVYNHNIFSLNSIIEMQNHLSTILKEVLGNLDTKIEEIEMLNSNEKERILFEFNDTYKDYPKYKTVIEIFEKQVERTPNDIAVIFEDKKLTYDELNKKANQLARSLKANNLVANDIVAIMVERSLEMMVAVFGILKAGGAYLPIDPNYPEGRVKFMLEDSKARILLTQEQFLNKVEFKELVMNLDDHNIYSKENDNLKQYVNPNDLAYIIYTSGSTGKPKGVMIENYSIINRLNWMQDKYPLGSEDLILQKTTYTFDVSVWELLWWALVGAKVCMLEPGKEKNPEAIVKTIEKNKVTTIHFVPSMFKIFMDSILDKGQVDRIKTLKRIFTSGEALGVHQVEVFRKKIYSCYPIELINLYGPTEATVDVTYFECLKDNYSKSIPIGKPIDNTQMYIIDKNNKLQPIGIPGELCISSDGLARGYLNRDDLTKAKFIQNPFLDGKRMYKTGDLARWRWDGNIEFLGRIDHQVKIRGFRIECGEVESRILDHEAIKDVIVIDKEDKVVGKILCAYLVLEANKPLDIGELRKFLSKSLPEYMIPSRFIQLDQLPLSLNGKVDRKLLPEPDIISPSLYKYEEPQNETQVKLDKIWQEVLGLEKIGIDNSFFELGGHSLNATIMLSKIQKEFNVELQLKEIFKFPTIRELSVYLNDLEVKAFKDIKKAETKDYYETSSAQKRMYMLQQFDLDSITYNMPGVMVIEGVLQIDKVREAFSKIIERHEILRTEFKEVSGKIVQIIHPKVDFSVEYEESLYEAELDEIITDALKTFIKPFNLKEVPLLRVKLIKLRKGQHLFLFDMHHIISDGLSIKILIDEFSKFYESYEMSELKIQYKDYTEWQNAFLNSPEMIEQEHYWLQQFSSEIPVLDIATDYPRPVIQSYEGDTIKFNLDKDIIKKLNSIASETGTTTYMILLSAINILLSKYSGQEDIVVGSLIAGRSHADLEKLVGVFINTLAIRNYPISSKSYIEFLNEVKENSLKAFQNQDYPFEELLDRLKLERITGRNPLFDVMFSMQNDMDIKEFELEDLKFKPYKSSRKVANFDLTFLAVQSKEDILLSIEYCTKLFEKDTIERMKEHFINLLKILTDNINVKIEMIDILTDNEKNKLLIEFNDNKTAINTNKLVFQLFEDWSENRTDKVAVEYCGEEFTYNELNCRSNQIARYMNKTCNKSELLAGIMLERSPEMVESILATWKLGGAYIPIDSEYPIERVIQILKDSGAQVLITKSKYLSNELEANFGGKILALDIFDEAIANEQCNNLNLEITPSQLAYVIYTSGSTGRPKGAMVEQVGMLNHMEAKIKELNITEESVIAQNASHCFDISVWQFFAAIISGGKTVIYPNEITRNPAEVVRRIVKDQVTILEVVPSFLSVMLDYLEEQKIILDSLKYILVTGEILKANLVEKWFQLNNNVKLVNAYGPTEASDDITHYFMDKPVDLVSIPIGYPIQNSNIYIVDKNMKLCPIGVKGEIVVSGIGVGRGYLNDLEKTKEVFMKDPFIKNQALRLYKTGDLGRWLPDGKIEFYGRKDYQVKIRGFRIELGEIENKLVKLPNINEVVVIDREDSQGNKHLYAYFTSVNEVDISSIRQELSEVLPGYMIPSYFIQLEKLPLTLNGKVDRKALPEAIENISSSEEYEAPKSNMEIQLAEIWCEVLGLEKVGIKNNFFELGGHSLKITTLISKIHKKLNVEVPYKEVFRYPTIKDLAKYIVSRKKHQFQAIEKVQDMDFYEVSSAQKRMYILQQLNVQSTSYNMTDVFILEGKLDKDKVNEVFSGILERHESLRTSFDTRDGNIVQIVKKQLDFNLDYFENSKVELDKLIKEFVKPFDLSMAPLFRVQLIRKEEEKHFLLIDIHHIISDGISKLLLMKEFLSLYNGVNLEKLNLQYKDYSTWQNKLLKSETIKIHEQYWKNVFSGDIPTLNIPTDYVRPSIQSFEGSQISFNLNEEIVVGLKEIAKDTGSTMYMILLAAINILLSKYSGQEDIIIGSPIAGRPHADLEQVIGMFVNTLAMRNYPKANKSYREFLEEIKANSIEAFEHQDYPFEELVEKLDLPRSMSRNPLFDVMFVMQNMDILKVEEENLKFKQYERANISSKFDLTFEAYEVGKIISFNIRYSTSLFKKETIEKMINHLENIFNVVSNDLNMKLGEIDMLTEAEKNNSLFAWNNTEVDYPKAKTVCELFEEQVQKNPNKVALVFQDEALTYKELNSKVNQLARLLIAEGIGNNSIVGLVVDRSMETTIGILAVIKAGAAYLPIDPEYPLERMEYMLNDSKVKVLLVQDNAMDLITLGLKTINLKDKSSYIGDGGNINAASNPTDLIYVIYTSGTSGQPKGVGVCNSNLINYIYWFKNKVNLTKRDKTIILSSLAFDLSYTAFYTGLLSGCEIHIVTKNSSLNAKFLIDYIEENNITYLKLTPSLFNILINNEYFSNYDKCKALRVLVLGGEKINLLDVDRYTKKYPEAILMNHYGPTETTIGSIAEVIDVYKKDNSIIIGKPINNTKVYILDKNLNLVPVGVKGEICISGAGVSKGYINNPELTISKFISNRNLGMDKSEILYRTGDCGRRLSDGRIEFLGRIDNQVKIRGFRVEIEEVERKLLGYKLIKDAVVLSKLNEGNDVCLYAYVVSEENLNVREIRTFLSKYLPEYMIPSYFIKLEQIPLTQNGKVDKKALTEVKEKIILGNDFEAPQNEIEEKLVNIWSRVLGGIKIGIADNFFDLGGNSLKAILLISEISKEFNVDIPLSIIFKVLTIEELAKYLLVNRYNSYVDAETAIRLNQKKDCNLFAFPPALGYGVAYSEISKFIVNYTVYSFDFIEAEDRINKYADEITKIQPKGEYNLLAYSAGGGLAFNVAKELERRGYEVAKLILFDCKPYSVRKYDNSIEIESRKNMIEQEFNNICEKMPSIKENINKEDIIKKVEKYAIYTSENSNFGQINADIFLILSLDKDIKQVSEVEIDERKEWWTLTRKSFSIYQGYGEHSDMLNEENSNSNAELIKSILKESAVILQ